MSLALYVVLVAMAADMVSTWVALHLGAVEKNPVPAFFVQHLGPLVGVFTSHLLAFTLVALLIEDDLARGVVAGLFLYATKINVLNILRLLRHG
jgi:hypothetical protein